MGGSVQPDQPIGVPFADVEVSTQGGQGAARGRAALRIPPWRPHGACPGPARPRPADARAWRSRYAKFGNSLASSAFRPELHDQQRPQVFLPREDEAREPDDHQRTLGHDQVCWPRRYAACERGTSVLSGVHWCTSHSRSTGAVAEKAACPAGHGPDAHSRCQHIYDQRKLNSS